MKKTLWFILALCCLSSLSVTLAATTKWPDFSINKIQLNANYSEPQAWDKTIGFDFTILNAWQKIVLSNSKYISLKCTDVNGTELLSRKITSWTYSVGKSIVSKNITNTNGSNIDLFPNAQKFQLNCKLSLVGATESNTSNNTKKFTFTVSERKVADVIISSMTLDPSKPAALESELLYFQVKIKNTWWKDFTLLQNQHMALICDFTDRSINLELTRATDLMWTTKTIKKWQTKTFSTSSIWGSDVASKEWENNALCEIKGWTDNWQSWDISYEDLYQDNNTSNNTYDLSFDIE